MCVHSVKKKAGVGLRTYLITQPVNGTRREGWHDICPVDQGGDEWSTAGCQVKCHAGRAGDGPCCGVAQLWHLPAAGEVSWKGRGVCAVTIQETVIQSW